MPEIHPTAIVDPSAAIADDVTIGPYTLVEPEVTIGAGCRIGGHVTLGRWLTLGREVTIHNYACVGTASQDMKHRGERSACEIGDGVTIREFVTVNRGTREGGVTRVGERASLLAYAHVAHECTVGPEAVLVNAATLGGEVVVGRRAVIGGLTGIHQFCHIGEFAIVGACSKVVQDIPPYLLADGHPARPYGPNRVGLERAGFTQEQIDEVRRIFRQLFERGEALEVALGQLEREIGKSPIEAGILEFCRLSTGPGRRGIARPRQRASHPDEASRSDITPFPFG